MTTELRRSVQRSKFNIDHRGSTFGGLELLTSVDAKPLEPCQDFGANIPVVTADLCGWQLFLLGQFPDLGPRQTQKLHQLTSCHHNVVVGIRRRRILVGHCRLFLVGVAPVTNGFSLSRESSIQDFDRTVTRSDPLSPKLVCTVSIIEGEGIPTCGLPQIETGSTELISFDWYQAAEVARTQRPKLNACQRVNIYASRLTHGLAAHACNPLLTCSLALNCGTINGEPESSCLQKVMSPKSKMLPQRRTSPGTTRPYTTEPLRQRVACFAY
jgi:hypothetical protein